MSNVLTPHSEYWIPAHSHCRSYWSHTQLEQGHFSGPAGREDIRHVTPKSKSSAVRDNSEGEGFNSLRQIHTKQAFIPVWRTGYEPSLTSLERSTCISIFPLPSHTHMHMQTHTQICIRLHSPFPFPPFSFSVTPTPFIGRLTYPSLSKMFPVSALEI